MTGLDELQAQRPVALGEIVRLQKCRGRQNHVGVSRGVGHHLIEDDREEILSGHALEHALLFGHRRDRVAVVDEQRLDRRIGGSVQRAAELVHVDHRVSGSGPSQERVMFHAAELLIE